MVVAVGGEMPKSSLYCPPASGKSKRDWHREEYERPLERLLEDDGNRGLPSGFGPRISIRFQQQSNEMIFVSPGWKRIITT